MHGVNAEVGDDDSDEELTSELEAAGDDVLEESEADSEEADAIENALTWMCVNAASDRAARELLQDVYTHGALLINCASSKPWCTSLSKSERADDANRFCRSVP
jgi:hypothetical protein